MTAVRDDTTLWLRSEPLPAGTAARRWIEQRDNGHYLYCGHCLRRFRRDTYRQADRLRDLHARTCKPRVLDPTIARHGKAWTEAEDRIILTHTAAAASKLIDRTTEAIYHRRRILSNPPEQMIRRGWTAEEDAAVLALTVAESMQRLGRTMQSVKARRRRLLSRAEAAA